ncbi:hypothetical protein BDZ89DRAFT_1046366 [Hymenopellis radicata]|nr:hypothetical protein BDZ89DRAFT_1046366 [Hymenopellis radicata]
MSKPNTRASGSALGKNKAAEEYAFLTITYADQPNNSSVDLTLLPRKNSISKPLERKHSPQVDHNPVPPVVSSGATTYAPTEGHPEVGPASMDPLTGDPSETSIEKHPDNKVVPSHDDHSSQSSLFQPSSLKVLTRVRETGLEFMGAQKAIPCFEPYRVLQSRPDKILRILNLTMTAEGHNLHSLFTADPNQFMKIALFPGAASYRIVPVVTGVPIAFTDYDAAFWFIGRVVKSELFDPDGTRYARTLWIQPILRFLPRMAAVASAILGYGKPLFQIGHQGLRMTTAQKPKEGKHGPGCREAVMNGVTHGDVERPTPADANATNEPLEASLKNETPLYVSSVTSVSDNAIEPKDNILLKRGPMM